MKGYELGLLYVDYSSGNFPLSLRVARHITTIEELIASYNGSLDDEDRAIVVENWPDYQEMVDTDDLGLYLK